MAHTFESLREAVITSTIRELAAGNSRVLNNLACGTGKTRTELLLAKTLGVKVVVIFVPRVNLAAQHSKYCENQKLLFMCADDSVSDDEKDLVTLDLPTIANFIRTPSEYQKVIFCTYTSSDKFLELYRDYPDLAAIELAVYDEAHVSSQISEGLFSCTLNEWAVKFNNRVFFTASPKNSMLDGEFGKIAYEYSTAQAIADKLIKDYYMVIATVATHQVRKLINTAEIAQYAGLAVAAAKAIKECDLSSLISFHSTVRGAKEMAMTWEKIKGKFGLSAIEADYVDGTMSTKEIKSKLARLAKGNYILCSCQVVGTGVDVPEIDGIIFSDPRESRISIQQAVGRGQRKKDSDDTQPLPIILPTIVDDDYVVAKFHSLIRFLVRLRKETAVEGARDNPVGHIERDVVSREPGVISLIGVDDVVDQSFIDAIELEINSLHIPVSHLEKFKYKCQEYEDFLQENFSYPRDTADASPKERDLANWARNLVARPVSGDFFERKKEIIDETITDFIWLNRNAKEGSLAFLKQTNILRRYVRTHGEFPPATHELTRWFKNKAMPSRVANPRAITTEQWDVIKNEFPSYYESLRDTSRGLRGNDARDQFLERITEIKTYYDAHGVLPALVGDATTAYISNLRTEISRGKQQDRKEWLVANFPEFFTGQHGETVDGVKVKYGLTPVAAFKEKHGREPDIFSNRDMILARRLSKQTLIPIE